jgi:hypothetical protein
MRSNVSIKQLRPSVRKEATVSTELEMFQNDVLRPILKLQHELFQFEWFQTPLFKAIQAIENPVLQRSQLSNFLAKNPNLTNRYIGMVCGLFTNEEFTFYLTQKSLVDKRIKELLITRFLSYQA